MLLADVCLFGRELLVLGDEAVLKRPRADRAGLVWCIILESLLWKP